MRISPLRAGGEHERAQPFHDGKPEKRTVDEVVDRNDDVELGRHVSWDNREMCLERIRVRWN